MKDLERGDGLGEMMPDVGLGDDPETKQKKKDSLALFLNAFLAHEGKEEVSTGEGEKKVVTQEAVPATYDFNTMMYAFILNSNDSRETKITNFIEHTLNIGDCKEITDKEATILIETLLSTIITYSYYLGFDDIKDSSSFKKANVLTKKSLDTWTKSILDVLYKGDTKTVKVADFSGKL